MNEKTKQIKFRNRNLMEFTISPEEIENSNDLINWLADHATAPHAEVDEFFLWIPPYSGYKRSIKTTYGKNIPKFIESILFAAINVRKKEKDQGYLLIAFI